MTRDDSALALTPGPEALQAATVAGLLPLAVQELARRFLDARRRASAAMLEMAEELAQIRAATKHGEWATFLEATGTSDDQAERLLQIARRAGSDPRFRELVQANFFDSVSTAALVARESTPEAVRQTAMNAPAAPSRREVERQIAAHKGSEIRTGADSSSLVWAERAREWRILLMAASDMQTVENTMRRGLEAAERISEGQLRNTVIAELHAVAQNRKEALTDQTQRIGAAAAQMLAANRENPAWQAGGLDVDEDGAPLPTPPLSAAAAHAEQSHALAQLLDEARAFGLLIDVSDGGVVVHWPGEDPTGFQRVTPAEALEWVRTDAAAELAQRKQLEPQRAMEAGPLRVSATEHEETITLSVHGGRDGSLVITDGYGVQLITLSMRRVPALLAAAAALKRALEAEAGNG